MYLNTATPTTMINAAPATVVASAKPSLNAVVTAAGTAADALVMLAATSEAPAAIFLLKFMVFPFVFTSGRLVADSPGGGILGMKLSR